MRRRRSIIPTVALALIGPTALFAAPPSTQPTTIPTSRPATTEPAANADAASEESMPQMEWPTIATAVKLAMKDKMLVMTTDLPAIEEAARLKVADFPGKTVAVVNHQHELPIITIRHDISVPPSTSIIYTLSSLQSDVRLSVDSEDGKELKSVQFIQNNMTEGLDPTDAPVKLYVSVTDMVNGTKPVDLKLLADDVVQLRRKYPRETAMYFQPMLAALRQDEVVFAVDHRAAWQVLQSHLTVDAKTEDKVKALIKELDAEEYATREAASESLEKLGEPAALVAMRMDRTGLSSEQNSRLDTFLSPYKPLNETDARKYATDVWFLIDCLYTDDQTIRDVAVKQLRGVTSRPIDLKTDSSPTTWRSSVRELRKQLAAGPTTSVSRVPASNEAN